MYFGPNQSETPWQFAINSIKSDLAINIRKGNQFLRGLLEYQLRDQPYKTSKGQGDMSLHVLYKYRLGIEQRAIYEQERGE